VAGALERAVKWYRENGYVKAGRMKKMRMAA